MDLQDRGRARRQWSDLSFGSDSGVHLCAPARWRRPRGGFVSRLATLPVRDQLSVGPDNTLFSGQFQAGPDSSAPIAVRQIWPDGGVSIFKSYPDVGKPSGLAYDSARRRLFVADSTTLQNGIHIFSVP